MVSDNHDENVKKIASLLRKEGYKTLITTNYTPDLIISKNEIVPLEFQNDPYSLQAKVKELQKKKIQCEKVLIVSEKPIGELKKEVESLEKSLRELIQNANIKAKIEAISLKFEQYHKNYESRETARISAIELKSKGFRNCEIQKALKTELGVCVTSRTIKDWVSGRTKTAGISRSHNKPKTV